VARTGIRRGQLKSGALKFADRGPGGGGEPPAHPVASGGPTCFGSSAKGNEYFLKHLLGTDNAVKADRGPEEHRPEGIEWPEQVPEGKLDLLLTSTSG
jgi:nitrate reductase alpha subunit